MEKPISEGALRHVIMRNAILIASHEQSGGGLANGNEYSVT